MFKNYYEFVEMIVLKYPLQSVFILNSQLKGLGYLF